MATPRTFSLHVSLQSWERQDSLKSIEACVRGSRKMQSLEFYGFGVKFVPVDQWQNIILVSQAFIVKFHFMLI